MDDVEHRVTTTGAMKKRWC